MKSSYLCLFYPLLFILSCHYSESKAELNLMDFLGKYQRGDVLVYSYISEDNSKTEIRLSVGSDIVNDGCYYRNFYMGDPINGTLHQFSLCADVSKGKFSVEEVLNFSDKDVKPIFSAPWLISSVMLLKEPIIEGKEWREKGKNGKEFVHHIVQILKDDMTNEVIVKVSYQEGGFYWYCFLSNQKGLIELTLTTFDLKTQKPQVIRKLKLESVEGLQK